MLAQRQTGIGGRLDSGVIRVMSFILSQKGRANELDPEVLLSAIIRPFKK